MRILYIVAFFIATCCGFAIPPVTNPRYETFVVTVDNREMIQQPNSLTLYIVGVSISLFVSDGTKINRKLSVSETAKIFEIFREELLELKTSAREKDTISIFIASRLSGLDLNCWILQREFQRTPDVNHVLNFFSRIDSAVKFDVSMAKIVNEILEAKPKGIK
jgi:hypothetical protein